MPNADISVNDKNVSKVVSFIKRNDKALMLSVMMISLVILWMQTMKVSDLNGQVQDRSHDYRTAVSDNNDLEKEILRLKADIIKNDELIAKNKTDLLKKTKDLAFAWCLKEAKTYIPEKEIHDIIDIAFKYDRWKLILSIIRIESNFDRYARSNKAAGGLMQVMFSVWGQELDIRDERALYDPEENIEAGHKVIAQYLEDSGWNINDALFKYVGKDKGREYEKKVLTKYAELSIYINERLNGNATEQPESGQD